MKHVLKPYDNRSDRQFDIVEIVYDFSMTRAARATKIACDNRKQKSYRVNRPLRVQGQKPVSTGVKNEHAPPRILHGHLTAVNQEKFAKNKKNTEKERFLLSLFKV